MPVLIPVIAAVAGSLVGGLIGGVLGTIVGSLVTLGVGLIGAALAPKPKSNTASFAQQQRDLTQIIRSSIEPRRIVYGETKISGPLVFANTPGGATGQLYLIIPFTDHQVSEFIELYLNDAIAHQRVSDGQSYYRQQIHASGTNLYTWTFYNGADNQAADSTFTAANPTQWTSNHRLRGISYVAVALASDPNVWTTGVPNIAAVLRGRKVYDLRDTPVTILSSAVGSPGIFSTSGAHGLSAGQRVFIMDHTGSVPSVGKEHQVATVPTSDTFTLLGNHVSGGTGETISITTGGTGGTLVALKWTNNAALCILDYLLARFGFNIDTDEFNVDAFTAAANTCDEMVAVTEVSGTFTADASTDKCTRTSLSVTINHCDAVQLTTTGTLPAGLSPATTYYYIRQHPTVSITTPDAGRPSAFVFKLATSLANARAGTAINITDAGTGTHTIVRKSQPRYVIDGALRMDVSPLDVVRQLLSACAGTLTYVQGEFRIAVGAYTTPTLSLDEDDLRGEISMRSRIERQELFNTVRGAYIDPTSGWLANDFPVITSQTLRDEDDGEEIARDIELPFTQDVTAAQRLAKITLLRARTGGRVIQFPAKLTALRHAPQDVIMLNNSKLGFVDAPYQITHWRISEDMGVDLTLSQIASSDFTWSASEAATPDRPATLQLLDASFMSPPGLTLTQENVSTAGADTVMALVATLTAPSSTNVDIYEVEMKVSTESTYRQLGVGAQLVYRVVGVEDGVTYDVRARSLNGTGAKSEYTSASLQIDAPVTGGTMWDSVAGNFDSVAGNWDDV